jgi:hypothetical protein
VPPRERTAAELGIMSGMAKPLSPVAAASALGAAIRWQHPPEVIAERRRDLARAKAQAHLMRASAALAELGPAEAARILGVGE